MKSICLNSNQEHYKLCLLENIVQKNKELESIVSNLIESLIANNSKLELKYVQLLTEKETQWKYIVDLCHSIAFQTDIKVDITEEQMKILK